MGASGPLGLTRVLALRRWKEERLVADLTESESRFRAVAETTDGAILLYWDTVSYANPGAARILGLDREDLIGKPTLELIHPDDRLRNKKPIDLLRKGDIPAVVKAASMMAEPGA